MKCIGLYIEDMYLLYVYGSYMRYRIRKVFTKYSLVSCLFKPIWVMFLIDFLNVGSRPLHEKFFVYEYSINLTAFN